MGITFLKPAELEAKAPKKVVTLLFGYRTRLLEAARDDETERGIIFDHRVQIADVFIRFGRGRHNATAVLFESLASPDGLLEHAPQSKPKRDTRDEERQRWRHSPGFYVYGEQLSWEQVGTVRKENKTGLKVGNDIPLNLTELFRIKDDGRPIYINAPIDERLLKQLAVLLHLRPALAERISFMSWQGEDSFTLAPYSQTASEEGGTALATLAQGLDEREAVAAQELGRFVYHQPEVGEIFHGVVVKVGEFGAFVQFLPGIEGLIHISEIRGGKLRGLQEGDEIIVEVKEIGRNGRIGLSENRAEKSMEGGKRRQPEFQLGTRQLFLTATGSENSG